MTGQLRDNDQHRVGGCDPPAAVHLRGPTDMPAQANMVLCMTCAGEEYLRNTKSILLRANLQRHDFTQRPTTGRGPRGGPVAA